MEWECVCGRKNPLKQCWCFLCGEPRPVAEGVPDEDAAAVAEILRRGSERLTEMAGYPMKAERLGGMARLTPDEARELVAEMERDLLASLDEWKYASR